MTSKIGVRLTDPKRIIDIDETEGYNLLNRCQDKISQSMVQLCRRPENGGNPFLFALAVSLPHELAVLSKKDERLGTAATTGKKFYWSPLFLDSLSVRETMTVMMHEEYHVIFRHCERLRGAIRQIAACAVDYAVNSYVEKFHKDCNRTWDLWGGNIGVPVSLADYIKFIDGGELPKIEGDFRIYADFTQYGRTPEEIYDEIYNHWAKSPRKCNECWALSLDPKTGKPIQGKDPVTGKKIPRPCPDWPNCEHKGKCCKACGALPDEDSAGGFRGIDSHIDVETSVREIESEVMRAAEQCKQMRGTVPGEIEAYLNELINPTVNWTDAVRCAFLRKSNEAGQINNWNRFRRKWLSATPKQYLPTRHTYKNRYCALLDTSGSMADEDILYCVSQLKSLPGEGFIVPVDAAPHWDHVTHVQGADDLKRTKVVGRGGTVFAEFFEQLPAKLGGDFDCVIVLTDGYIDEIPTDFAPRCDTFWVLSCKNEEFKPPFGRILHLRDKQL